MNRRAGRQIAVVVLATVCALALILSYSGPSAEQEQSAPDRVTARTDTTVGTGAKAGAPGELPEKEGSSGGASSTASISAAGQASSTPAGGGNAATAPQPAEPAPALPPAQPSGPCALTTAVQTFTVNFSRFSDDPYSPLNIYAVDENCNTAFQFQITVGQNRTASGPLGQQWMARTAQTVTFPTVSYPPGFETSSWKVGDVSARGDGAIWYLPWECC